MRHVTYIVSAVAIRFLCVRHTAFGRDVVPEVNIRV